VSLFFSFIFVVVLEHEDQGSITWLEVQNGVSGDMEENPPLKQNNYNFDCFSNPRCGSAGIANIADFLGNRPCSHGNCVNLPITCEADLPPDIVPG